MTTRTARARSAATEARSNRCAPRIDQIIEALILALLLYLPLAFGGVMPTSRIVLIAFGALIAACFAVRCVAEPDAKITVTWAFAPLIGLVLLTLFQLVPLPISVVEILSPTAASIWQTAAAASQTELTTATLSVYPHATQNDIVLLGCATIVLIVGATIYRRRGAFRRLLTGLALIGLLVALIGLVQLTLGADLIYWTFEGPGAANAGPFASHSHYSEFINLALGATLGVILIRAADHSRSRELEIHSLIEWNGRGVRLPERALFVFLFVGVAAIVLSGSRSGLISLVVAAGVSAALMQGMRKVEGIGWPMVGFAGLAFGGLLSLGIDPVISQFQATAGAPADALSTRIELVRDTTSMALAFGAVGAGLGTYALAFPGFDTATRGGTAEHAENEYVELLAEFGMIGMALAIAFTVMTVVIVVRQIRNHTSRSDLGLFGILFGLAAIAFHSLTDFGLEIPAVAIAVATLIGAGLARSAPAQITGNAARMTAAGAAALAAVLMATALPLSFQSADAEYHALLADRARSELNAASNGIGTTQQHASLIEHTSAAAAADPNNVEHRFWAAFAEWNAAVADARNHTLESPAVSPLTHPELAEPARKVIESLCKAIQEGPTHGPSWSVAGQLASIWLPEGEFAKAGDWILRGCDLAPHHPSTCLAAAFEQFRRDEEAKGLAMLDRAIAVGASKHGVVDLLASDLERPNLALPFVDGDLGLTERLLAHVQKTEGYEGLAADLTDEVRDLLIAACARPSAKPQELARLAAYEQADGNFDGAELLYRRLLSADPFSRDRLKYAQLLIEAGDTRSARRELRDVIQFHPGYSAAVRLLQQLDEGSRR